MLTGEIRNQVDRIWDAFWSGGTSNPIEGVTMANLNTAVVRALPFVYSPLVEQRRIAEVLDRAEALRAKRCASLAELDALSSSLQHRAFRGEL